MIVYYFYAGREWFWILLIKSLNYCEYLNFRSMLKIGAFWEYRIVLQRSTWIMLGHVFDFCFTVTIWYGWIWATLEEIADADNSREI